jgi:hypothetical protein
MAASPELQDLFSSSKRALSPTVTTSSRMELACRLRLVP